MSGFSHRPRVLRGAFFEPGLSVPPLIVPFQFNPVELRRNRTLDYRAPNDVITCPDPTAAEGERRVERTPDLRKWHGQRMSLDEIRDDQNVTVNEESISFELHIDATDDLGDGRPIPQMFGVAPRLAALEQMTTPRDEGVLASALGDAIGHTFAGGPKPPSVLFFWGAPRVLPVNITGVEITETEFDLWLNPVRATVAVALTVIEGGNAFFTYSRTAKEIMAALNLANLVTDITIPG